MWHKTEAEAEKKTILRQWLSLNAMSTWSRVLSTTTCWYVWSLNIYGQRSVEWVSLWMNFTNQNKTPWWSCLWDPQVSQWSFLLRCQLFFSVRDIFALLLIHRIQFSWNKESHWQLKSFLLCSYFMTPIFGSASFSLIFFLVYCTLA